MRCAALPYIGQAKRGERWVDTGANMMGPDDHVYLSRTAVLEAAKLFGWVPPGEVKAAKLEVARLEIERDAALQEAVSLRKSFEAIDVLASQGYQARKKPGRPLKETVT